MKEDIKYPTILKSIDGSQTVVVYRDGSAYHIDGEFKGEYSKAYNTDDTINAGKEVLANTYGKVESKEHAEFIVELAKLNNLDVYVDDEEIERNYFTFNKHGKLFFYKCSDEAVLLGRKLITIPMSPKEVEEIEVVEYEVGDKVCVNGACGDIVSLDYGAVIAEVKFDHRFTDKVNISSMEKVDVDDEWPKVNDRVLICKVENYSRISDFNNKEVKVIAKTEINQSIVLTILHYARGIGAIKFDEKFVKKPKTPEEELRDELIGAMDDSTTAFTYAEYLAKYLLDQYTLTKKQ